MLITTGGPLWSCSFIFGTVISTPWILECDPCTKSYRRYRKTQTLEVNVVKMVPWKNTAQEASFEWILSHWRKSWNCILSSVYLVNKLLKSFRKGGSFRQPKIKNWIIPLELMWVWVSLNSQNVSSSYSSNSSHIKPYSVPGHYHWKFDKFIVKKLPALKRLFLHGHTMGEEAFGTRRRSCLYT